MPRKPGRLDDTTAPRESARASDLNSVIALRLTRRRFVLASAAGSMVASLGLGGHADDTRPPMATEPAIQSRFRFTELKRATGTDHAVAPEYRADVLIRWGDPLFADSPPFEPHRLTPAAQARQFGYNNDYLGFIPLPEITAGEQRGLLCVNHEYASSNLMFADFSWIFTGWITEKTCGVELAAHGGSVVEIARVHGLWRVVTGSALNRRILGFGTPMKLTGPAAGHERLKTGIDPTGTCVNGMIANCAGGITAWQTWLSCEENFNGGFMGEIPEDHPETRNHGIYGVPEKFYRWGKWNAEFDVTREPRSPNRFGWVVEIDPLDPASVPKKRTALGRLKHEGAESVVAKNGRVVVYMGDDQKFEHVYKFVSRDAFNPDDRKANLDLLDHGTLYTARFDADGTVHWLPLLHGQGPLTPANQFQDQGDVLIETRMAADLLGATPMDRPEDIQVSPVNGRVYVVLTNNDERDADQVDAANPRADNVFGHIIEVTEDGNDHTANRGRWEILVRCGDPADEDSGAMWNAATTADGWFGAPDNIAFDPTGRMWVATDGNDGNDGLWGVETEGALRGTGKAFYRAPEGAEVCGPCFTPDGQSLFLAIQHPGDALTASFDDPDTRWPDFAEDMPPRPAVVVVQPR
jgi:secreted PhoX family phosphatase